MKRPSPIPASALPAAAFRAPARVRFGDCDPAGIVFFPNWFSMASATIEDLFRERLGIDFHALHAERGIGTGFVHAAASFMRPGMMGDDVLLTPLIRRIGGASYALDLHIHRGEEELARLDLVTATTDLATRTSRPVPPDLRAALLRYMSECGPSEGQEIPA
ncbi:acyl-CoA thioesterase [Roseomonas sp. SSH11]|uniref:Acyl-CoA thioesterase n=1 Tax=Pararoseomonas baculiformis TaxID=2820812 RepID=A0ABS4AF23_9PROT|nr:thioesterase family protein [Pararoseomonas baculiformis]MBP0445633.1 acyl-CoA thioesterase [Pararoseomonas baculiformis]